MNEAKLRDREFKVAYGLRVVQLAPFMRDEDRQRLEGWAGRNGRAMARKTRKAPVASRTWLLLEEADEIAKRYALWTVLKKFEWWRIEKDPSPEGHVALDLLHSMWRLDVELRHRLEKRLLSGGDDPTLLRYQAESAAGHIAGSLIVDLGRWEDVRRSVGGRLDEVSDEMDELLRLAGSPPGSADHLAEQ